jgi:hypothetical protein
MNKGPLNIIKEKLRTEFETSRSWFNKLKGHILEPEYLCQVEQRLEPACCEGAHLHSAITVNIRKFTE